LNKLEYDKRFLSRPKPISQNLCQRQITGINPSDAQFIGVQEQNRADALQEVHPLQNQIARANELSV
jgi:hypothetical protein